MNAKVPRPLLVGFWGCIVIAAAVVLRRVFALSAGPRPGATRYASLDAAFQSHAALTLAHIVPALVLVLLLPVVLLRPGRSPAWVERVVFLLGAVVGVTAYAMSSFAVGGWLERSAVLFFNTLFLFSLFRAYQYGRVGKPELKRQWLLRAMVVLLGIATTRPVMGVFFATSALTHMTPDQFFGMAFWIGFSINAVTIEWWLRRRRRDSLRRLSPAA